MGPCSLCGRPVLGLAGQDWSLLSWMLDADPATVAGVRPGPCHVRCLDESGSGRRWAEAVERYHCTRWPDAAAGRDAGVRWRLHGSPPARRFHLWRSDGRLASFPYAAVRHDPVALTVDLAEVGTAPATLLHDAMGTDAYAVEVPLSRVLAALGLADRYPDGRGSVTRRTRNLGTAHRPELIDVLVARHALALDPGCRRAAHLVVMGSGHGFER